jgi:hypothetical protein
LIERRKFTTVSIHLDALGLHADAELRMVPNAAFDDVSNVLERGREISESIVAERDVIREVGIEPNHLHETHISFRYSKK